MGREGGEKKTCYSGHELSHTCLVPRGHASLLRNKRACDAVYSQKCSIFLKWLCSPGNTRWQCRSSPQVVCFPQEQPGTQSPSRITLVFSSVDFIWHQPTQRQLWETARWGGEELGLGSSLLPQDQSQDGQSSSRTTTYILVSLVALSQGYQGPHRVTAFQCPLKVEGATVHSAHGSVAGKRQAPEMASGSHSRQEAPHPHHSPGGWESPFPRAGRAGILGTALAWAWGWKGSAGQLWSELQSP